MEEPPGVTTEGSGASIVISPSPHRSPAEQQDEAAFVGATALLVLAGCGGEVITGTGFERRLAVIELSEGDPVVVEAPATATRGVAFEVAVTTYGGGCVEEADTDVEVSGLTATVEPYQLVVVDDDVICTADLRMGRHVARVRFDQAGTGIIRFRGISGTGGDTLTVERTVAVQ